MGKYDDISEEYSTVSNFTDSDVQSYVNSMVNGSTIGVIDHFEVEKVLADFLMPMKIADEDAQITTYCDNFFERLEIIGCGNFREQNSKKTMRLLLSRLKTPTLKTELRQHV